MTARRPAPPPAPARAAGPRRPRPARRARIDLDRVADRRARLARRRPRCRVRGVRGAAGRGNLLYTPYIDLRAAQLGEATARRPAPATDGRCATCRPTPTRSSRSTTGTRRRDRPVAGGPRGRRPLTLGARRDRSDRRRRCSRPSPPCRRRQVRPADARRSGRTAWSSRRAGRRPPRPADRRALVARCRRSGARRPARSSGSGPARRPRSSRSSSPARRTPRGATGQAFFAGTTEVALGAGATLPGREPPGAGRPTSSPSSTGRAEIGEDATLQWALAQLGGRARPLARRQPAGRRPQLGRAGRDRVRRRGPAVRPDLVHAHVGRDTTGDLLSKGALLENGPDVPQGPDHHREDRHRHRQLPRRVRDEPLEARALRRHPEPRDRPAGLPPGGTQLARSARSTRRSCSTSSRAASRPTRRASSSSSGSSSRSWPASRWPRRRTGCATLLEAKWAAGPSAHGGAQPEPPTGRAMRRIDLLGVDEVGDGEMRMVWVDGTDQVARHQLRAASFTAVQGVCSHEYFELDKGFLTDGTLTCALHLSRFDLSDGEPLDPPAEAAARGLPGRRGGRPGPHRGPGRPAGDQRVGTGSTQGARPGRRGDGPEALVEGGCERRRDVVIVDRTPGSCRCTAGHGTDGQTQRVGIDETERPPPRRPSRSSSSQPTLTGLARTGSCRRACRSCCLERQTGTSKTERGMSPMYDDVVRDRR